MANDARQITINKLKLLYEEVQQISSNTFIIENKTKDISKIVKVDKAGKVETIYECSKCIASKTVEKLFLIQKSKLDESQIDNKDKIKIQLDNNIKFVNYRLQTPREIHRNDMGVKVSIYERAGIVAVVGTGLVTNIMCIKTGAIYDEEKADIYSIIRTDDGRNLIIFQYYGIRDPSKIGWKVVELEGLKEITNKELGTKEEILQRLGVTSYTRCTVTEELIMVVENV